jgi:hypothetical protein
MAGNPPWRRRGGGSEGRGWRLRAIVAFWARIISVSAGLQGRRCALLAHGRSPQVPCQQM